MVLNALKSFGDVPIVAEVYSPPRIAAQAMTVGLRPGFSIDTGTLKPDGTPWDLEDDRDFKMLKMWRREEKPVLLCGSPPCNAFSNPNMEQIPDEAGHGRRAETYRVITFDPVDRALPRANAGRSLLPPRVP